MNYWDQRKHCWTQNYFEVCFPAGSNSQQSNTVTTTVPQHITDIATKSIQQVLHWQGINQRIEHTTYPSW